MGWYSEEAPGHEGHAVGVLKLVDGLSGTRYLATVDAPDPSVQEVQYACAICDCGWRSERIKVGTPMAWRHGSLACVQPVWDRLRRLWTEHAALSGYRRIITFGWSERERKIASAALIAELSSIERCLCGHERREHGLGEGGLHRFCIVRDADGLSACDCREFRFMPSPP